MVYMLKKVNTSISQNNHYQSFYVLKCLTVPALGNSCTSNWKQNWKEQKKKKKPLSKEEGLWVLLNHYIFSDILSDTALPCYILFSMSIAMGLGNWFLILLEMSL